MPLSRVFSRLAALLLIALLLAACGHKGALVKPSAPPESTPPAAPTPAQPVEPAGH